VGTLGIEEALEALAGVGVAVSGVVVVPVVAAVARNARPARNFRVAVVVVGADGATQTCRRNWVRNLTVGCLLSQIFHRHLIKLD